MKTLRIVVPVIITALLTAFAVFSAIWLTSLVPGGAWSELIKAGIVVFIVGSLLIVFAWSAYFAYIIEQSLRRNLK